MFKSLVIIGAGGHGRVIADIALKLGYTDISFIDDNQTSDCMGFPVIGKCDILNTYDGSEKEFVIAIGDNKIRKRIAEKYNLNWATLIHPSAQIGFNVKTDVGTVVMANAVINTCSSIGKHCIINSGAVVEHDNVIGDYVHISPRAALGGTVTVGDETHICIGVTVINNVNISEKCTVGAGAAVINSLPESGTYIGVPAKKAD